MIFKLAINNTRIAVTIIVLVFIYVTRLILKG